MVVAFQPGGGVSDQCKAGCVAFGKAVLAEAANLFEYPLREFGCDAFVTHP
jgi:hypothetical protein